MAYKVLTMPRITNELFGVQGPRTADDYKTDIAQLEADLNEVGGHLEATFQRGQRSTITYVVVRTDD